jgi:competence protein ComEC
VIALAATGAAGLAAQLEEAARDRPDAPLEATFDGTVASVTRGLDGAEVELEGASAASGEIARVPARIRVRDRSRDGAPAPSPIADALPGDRLRLRARLRAPEGRANPGGGDRERELARRGVGAVGSLLHPDLVVRMTDGEGWRPLAPLHEARARGAARLRREGDGGALLAALALGDRGGLGAPLRDAFRQLGLTHLLSVSGLHLALVAVGAFRLSFALGRRLPALADARRGALGAAVLAAVAYALLAGFEVPVQRSLVMLAALAAAVFARRPVRRSAPLLVAALAILARDPAALFDAGAQMSFLATAGLVLALRADAPPRGAGGRLAELFDTSALATAATAPVAAAAIGSVSPWGLLANAVAVPWTGVALLPPALLAAAVACASQEGAAAGALIGAAAAVADGSLAALRAVAALAPPAWDARPAPGWVSAALAAAVALLRVRRTRLRIGLALAITAALALAPPARIDPAPPRLVVLDVGQGDASLVQGARGTLLVDAGTALPGGADLGARVVVPALRALGVTRLDVVAASHADLDHRGGLAAVLAAVPAERLWLPRGAAGDPVFAPLVAAARARGVRVEEKGAGDPLERVGDLEIRAVWPPREAPGGLSRNDRSLVLRIAVGSRTVLLPGDVEAPAEEILSRLGTELRAGVVKLPHHGSRTSSTAALLDAAGGDVAIVSAPRASRFGMPHAEVLARARARGYAVWWTGRHGAVLVSLGPTLWARGWRE